jgi:L-alanine-DL-glutamate epimerase-like enolase superfamily enzyme
VAPAIVAIETVRWEQQPNVLWARLTDASGAQGLGETFYSPSAVESIVHELAAPLMLGRSASAERTAQELFAVASFAGYAGVELRAFSALDIALWDLLGRRCAVSVGELLGGRVRETIPTYNTCVSAGGYDDAEAFLERPGELAIDLLGRGVRAMKIWPWDRFAPQVDVATVTGPAGWSAVGPVGHRLTPEELAQGLWSVQEAVRATEGQMTVMIEGHGRWDLNCALAICRALEPLNVGWVEDLMLSDSAQDLRRLVAETRVPQAVSERLMSRHAYRRVLEAGAAHVAKIDVAWTGGLTEARKIAAMADTYHLPIAPHDCTGPVTFAASLQLCAHAPNTMVMESVRGFCEGWYRDVLEVSPTPDGGMIAIPDEPGLGVQLSEAFLTRSDVTVTRSEA